LVDGQPAAAYVVDHLFRGVLLPPGEHLIEWRYQPRSTILGIALTLTTMLGLFALGAAPLWRSRRLAGLDRRPVFSPLLPSS
jgi:hypothetical protein